ncbi:helicase, partial [Listeria monocytogenes]|nr:helicase [Listeria monocytogenes]
PIQIDDAAELQEITEPIFQVDYSSPNDCKNMKELYEYAKQHNYKRGWAFHQGKARGFIK